MPRKASKTDGEGGKKGHGSSGLVEASAGSERPLKGEGQDGAAREGSVGKIKVSR
jgi:hypothetical protein